MAEKSSVKEVWQESFDFAMSFLSIPLVPENSRFAFQKFNQVSLFARIFTSDVFKASPHKNFLISSLYCKIFLGLKFVFERAQFV